MLKSVKIAAILGLATVTTLAFLDSSAEAGRRRYRHRGYDCCYNNSYAGGYYGGCHSGCGSVSPCGQSAPCSNGACGVQQQPAGACNACGACNSTTMSPAPQPANEYSAARPTYRDSNGGEYDVDQPTTFDRDQYLREQRLNNPAARTMTDEQILQQRNVQQNLNENLRQDQQQLNQDANQTLQKTDRQIQNTNQQLQNTNQQIRNNIDQNVNQNLNRANQAVPKTITPPTAIPPAVK